MKRRKARSHRHQKHHHRKHGAKRRAKHRRRYPMTARRHRKHGGAMRVTRREQHAADATATSIREQEHTYRDLQRRYRAAGRALHEMKSG
jgi:hypothetical protein